MAAMIVGMVNMPAKAAEVAMKDVTIESFRYSGEWFEPQFHLQTTNWRVYFNMSDSLVIPSGSAYYFNLKLSNGDEEREVAFTSTSEESDVIYTTNIPSDFLDGCKAQTITIKRGTYKATNADYALNLTADCVFYVNAYSWSMNESNVTPTVKQKATFNLDTSVLDGAGGTAAGFYLKPNFDDGSKSGADWKTDVTAMRVNYADAVDTIHYGGVFVNGVRQSKRVIKVSGQSYYVELGEAEQGKEYTVRGFFKDADGKPYAYLPITVTWDGTKWTEKDLGVLESYESELTVFDDYWTYSDLNAIVLFGTDEYLMDQMFVQDTNEDYKKLTPGENSGIYINGELATQPTLYKRNANEAGVYYVTGLSDIGIKNGDYVTIKGDFYTNNGKTKITYKERDFVYDTNKYDSGNAGWVNFYHSSLEMENRGWFDTANFTENNTRMYLHGTDSFLEEVDEVSNAEPGSHSLSAVDSTSGIYLNGEKKNYTFTKEYGGKHKDSPHIYNINGMSVGNGDIITIEGTFETGDKKTQIRFDKSQFQWNGATWAKYIPTDDKVASVTMAPHFNNAWFAPTYDENKGGWRVYFYTSEALKGNTYDKYTLRVSNGTEEADITFTQSEDASNKEIYAYFPKKIVDGTTTQTITIKAGEYKATNSDNVPQEYGMQLTSDSKIYVTEYGWSIDKSMVTPTTAPVSFTLNGGTAEGINLIANMDDTVPYEVSDWSTGTVSPILISQETYGVQSGVFKNDELTEVYMMKTDKKSYYVALSDKGQTANAGDVYTIKGMFRHTDGQSIACTELKVKWNGESWEKVFDSFETNLSWKLDGSWFYPTYDAGQDGWRIYLKADMDIPALQGEVYKLNVKIDGTTHVINFTKSDAASPNMHAYIPKSLVSGAKTQTIEFQPGTYNAFSGDVQKDYALTVKNTLVMRVNEYGWTTETTHIAPSYNTKENIQLDTSALDGAGGDAKGFYVTTDVNNDLEPNEWNTRIYIPAATETTYYSGGVWKQEADKTEKKQSYEKSQLIKLTSNSYYVALEDAELVATSPGDIYTVGGIFKDTNTGKTYGFSTITVTWDGTKWTQNYQPLDDTGVKYDVNADSVAPTTKDLIALLKYNADNSYRINTAQADINNDSKINKEDVGTLRRIIVGSVTYQNGKVYGMPSYSENRVISKAAYASVKIGDWDGSNLTVSSYYDDKVVDAEMQKYKAAGINLLLSEGVAQYHQDRAKNEPIKRYLEAAERNGLGVLVFSGVIQYMFTNGSGPEIYNWEGGTWQDELDKAIVELRGYSDSAFKGFMIWDEIQVKYLDTFNKIASYLHEKYPELILMTSQLPSEAYTVSNLGPDAFTTDTTNNNTVDKAYKDYVNSFSQATNMFIFDSYPLILTNEYGDAKKIYSVSDNWFANHKYVAEVAKESGYNFNKGVTIQSCQLEGSGNWWSSNVRYAPEKAEDIGFQVYTSMAYGVKEIHYFTYNLHHIDNAVSQTMATNTNVYDAVSTINNRIDKFANVYQAFSWRDTQDIEKGKSVAKFTTDSERLTSATVTGARTLIGHMVDSDGFDGYMLANAAGPRTTTAASVAMTFVDTTKVIVYDFQNGTRQVVSGATVNISVPVGGGIMVIPVR